MYALSIVQTCVQAREGDVPLCNVWQAGPFNVQSKHSYKGKRVTGSLVYTRSCTAPYKPALEISRSTCRKHTSLPVLLPASEAEKTGFLAFAFSARKQLLAARQ